MNKITLQLVFTLFCIPAVAQIHPSTTTDLVMPGGPYMNVLNTGAAISECSSCSQSVVHAYTWDGDSPGFAVYEPGLGTFVYGLPGGATDPDIVIGNDGYNGVVVYELNGGVEYQSFTYSSGNISLVSLKILSTNAQHPNIDNPNDCESTNPSVIVYEDLNAPANIYYSVGTLNGLFNVPIAVPNQGLSTGVALVNRKYPDVQVYQANKYLFVSTGTDLIGNNYVDLFDFGTGLNGFTSGNALLPGVNAKPRIDGVVANPVLDYAYAVTYHDHNSVRHGFQNQAISTLQGASSGDPAIAYTGDFHDAVWPSDLVNSPNFDVIGKGFNALTPDALYKELNDPLTSGKFDKWAVSIAGSCNLDYAVCWVGDNEIYYKQANTGGSSSYKMQPNFENLAQVDIYNIHGQLIKSCKAEEFDDVYLSLPHSVYIINKIDNLGQLLSAEKVVK